MWLAGVIAVSSAGLRLYRARRRLTPGVIYLCAAVAAVGCSAALAAPLTVELLIPVELFSNFTRWLANSLAMVAAWSVHALLLHLVYAPEHARPSVRRQVVILAAALATMTLLLLGAGIPSAPDFVAAAGDHWQITAYVTVFCGYVAYNLANFVRLMSYYARLSARPWLRRGLGMARVGAAVGIGWAVVKILAAITVLAGDPGGWEILASAILSATCVSPCRHRRHDAGMGTGGRHPRPVGAALPHPPGAPPFVVGAARHLPRGQPHLTGSTHRDRLALGPPRRRDRRRTPAARAIPHTPREHLTRNPRSRSRPGSHRDPRRAARSRARNRASGLRAARPITSARSRRPRRRGRLAAARRPCVPSRTAVDDRSTAEKESRDQR
ncbi:hypothetical protein GCM10027563_41060 [Parasphingorhabdus pacifica]